MVTGKKLRCLLLLSALVSAGAVQAQAGGYPYWGYGPGALGGYAMPPQMGPGYGYGPGMMGPGYGYGPGPGYGPGMMGPGLGYGPGMRGPGLGGPMMGMGPGGEAEAQMGWLRQVYALDLSNEQRETIDRLLADFRERQRDLAAKLQQAYGKLPSLFRQDQWNAADIQQQYDRVHELRRGMIASLVKVRNQIFSELSKEQRDRLLRSPYPPY